MAGLAEVDVTGTPSYAYLTQDHLGSTRGLWDGTLALTGAWEYTPYGAPYKLGGPSSLTALYTGHDLDKVTGNYYAPFRTLNSMAGRWLSQDPLGMVDGTNVYGYVQSDPIGRADPTGLISLPNNGFSASLFAGCFLGEFIGSDELAAIIMSTFAAQALAKKADKKWQWKQIGKQLFGKVGARLAPRAIPVIGWAFGLGIAGYAGVKCLKGVNELQDPNPPSRKRGLKPIDRPMSPITVEDIRRLNEPYPVDGIGIRNKMGERIRQRSPSE